MVYPIVPYGNEILRKKAMPITSRANIRTIIKRMFATVDLANGLGLAAPQIGLSIQLFVTNFTPLENEPLANKKAGRKVFINPVIEVLDATLQETYEEGCLSIPGVFVPVPRVKEISIQFLDSEFKPQKEILKDMRARVVLHEYDHLLGKLPIDYADEAKKQEIAHGLKTIEAGKVRVNYPMLIGK